MLAQLRARAAASPAIVGKGVALRSEPDGLHGSFSVHETQDGDKALDARQATGSSTASRSRRAPKKTIRTPRGRRPPRQGAPATRSPSAASAPSPSAIVLAVREEADHRRGASAQSTDIDPELVDRCRRLGIELPQRYQAHPDETDTPAETGTSETAPASPRKATTLGGSNELHQSEMRLSPLIDERESYARSCTRAMLGERARRTS